MTRKSIKIGVAGTHSTGKSSFLAGLAPGLERLGLRTYSVAGIAQRAADLGFPILTQHTFESTLWIMSECMRQEAEASLVYDVILVDRPVLDALGYFHAALEVTRRREPPRRMEELRAIARAHSGDYDLLLVTSLDRNIPIADGRDQDALFREAAARHIEVLAAEFAPDAWRLTLTNAEELVRCAGEFVSSRLSKETAP